MFATPTSPMFSKFLFISLRPNFHRTISTTTRNHSSKLKFIQDVTSPKCPVNKLPVLRDLRQACKRILALKVTNVDDFLHRLQELIGPEVRLNQRVVNLACPTVKENIHLLNKAGLSLQHVLERPSLLQFSREEIEQRAKGGRLTGQALGSAVDGKHANRCYDQSRDRPWMETLAQKLDCSVSELLKRAPSKLNALYPRSQTDYIEKIDLLLDAGGTKEQILSSLGVLNKSTETLRARLVEIRKLDLDEHELPVKLLTQGNPSYNSMIECRRKFKALLGPHPDQWRCLAEKLNTTPAEVKENFEDFDLKCLIPKIDILLEMGLEREEILLRPRLTRFSLVKLQKARDMALEYDLELRPSVVQYFLTHDAFPTNGAKSIVCDAICKLLDCERQDIAHSLPYMTLALHSKVRIIEDSIRTLMKHGVQLADIRSCPLVLNHNAEALAGALRERDICSVAQWKDNVQLLNALVYVLERTRNFRDENVVEEVLEDESIIAAGEDDSLDGNLSRVNNFLDEFSHTIVETEDDDHLDFIFRDDPTIFRDDKTGHLDTRWSLPLRRQVGSTRL